jgi:hypothetical protein
MPARNPTELPAYASPYPSICTRYEHATSCHADTKYSAVAGEIPLMGVERRPGSKKPLSPA